MPVLLVSPFEGKGQHDGRRPAAHDWKQFDTLAVPGGWFRARQHDSDRAPVFLFIASDEPTVEEARPLQSKWGKTKSDEILQLV